MSRQVSPFATLTGAEKQIKWLEYQSIRLPYVPAETEKESSQQEPLSEEDVQVSKQKLPSVQVTDRPQPPPEVPRTMPDMQKIRHSQYDAVIARLKQAELQSKQFQQFSSQSTKQTD